MGFWLLFISLKEIHTNTETYQ